ncbi:conserved hypothetical protein [Candidatus Terasakiella magnetica]|nr:conserved hypothetical protein [Candidatus Terasakiella magnetica]
MILVYGTTIAMGGRAVLLRGSSGSGKSDLALRLIEDGAVLVADDQTALTREDAVLVARPPAAISGLLEVRGLGLVRLPYLSAAPLVLVIDLVAPGAVERLPEAARAAYLELEVPLLALAPFEASAAAKVRLAMRCATRDIITA